ncbi:DinB family protein [Jeotgalibacillus proteolyticus]|uniref:Damage-inducible protein DinB n=1 Tax=Jeotgalibacillus proteolyticus TaxID=2082395 RepID=A0A2S5G7H4_9BACL|nr:DinB family protein [Jeotgalibacillus proteolyticus]PPA68884.1 hypothetical protein C4B60_18380 [Jeotgalibacillus proteolyticus]
MISLQDWFSYHIWGTARQLNHLAELPDIYEKEIESVFPTIRAVFEHVWVVDALWLERMKGLEKPVIEGKKLPGIQEAKLEFAKLHQDMMEFITSTKDPTAVHKFRTMKDIPMENSIEEMVYTVVNHGSYHRGNVTAMHRQLGYEGTPYDYIYFLNELKNKE